MPMLGIYKEYAWSQQKMRTEHAWNMHEDAWNMQREWLEYAWNTYRPCLEDA